MDYPNGQAKQLSIIYDYNLVVELVIMSRRNQVQ